MAKAAKKPAKPGKGKKPGKPGRPSKYSDKLIKAICDRLSKGEPMAVICRDEGMPDPSTVWDWEKARPDVSQAIARAREAGHDAIALDALSIADDGTRDYIATETGGLIVNHDHIARSRLRVDTRLKLLAKWDPKRYGDKVQLAGHDGGELPQAPQFVIQPVAPPKSDE